MEMKRSYFTQEPNESKPRRSHDADMEECDADLTKQPRASKPKKPFMQRKWVEKSVFERGANQQYGF